MSRAGHKHAPFLGGLEVLAVGGVLVLLVLQLGLQLGEVASNLVDVPLRAHRHTVCSSMRGIDSAWQSTVCKLDMQQACEETAMSNNVFEHLERTDLYRRVPGDDND